MAAVLLFKREEILSVLHLNHLVALLRVEDDPLETGVLVGPQEWGCGVFFALLPGIVFMPHRSNSLLIYCLLPRLLERVNATTE